MSKQLGEGRGVRRGFTTLQLLELAAIATKNYLQSSNQDASGKMVAGVLMRDIPGLVIPAKGNIVNSLSGPGAEGWFNDGKTAPKLRAKTREGQAIEALRPQIMQYVQRGMQFITQPQYYKAATAGFAAGQPAAGSVLENALKTSWSWGYKPKGVPSGINLQQRIAAVQAVMQATGAQEPADAVIERAGAVGAKKPASIGDAQGKIGASSGFQSAKVREFLSKSVRKDARAVGGPQGQAAALVSPAIRAVFGIPDSASLAQAQAQIAQRASTPQQVHAAFSQMANQLGAQAKDAVWLVLSQGGLKDLISGLYINSPGEGANKKFVWDANQGSVQQPQSNYEFSRYVFDLMFDQYLQRGGGGDVLPADAAKRSSARRVTGARGILGTDDKALQGLSLAAPKKVAAFARKASQNQYSMEALKAGARAIGAQFDEGAIIHDAVIGAVINHVVRSYASGVDSGDALKTSAVAAALKLNGYGKLQGDASLLAQARAAINRKLDAMYGKLTAPCNSDNYSLEDVKRIAKGASRKVSDISSIGDGCSALQGVQQEGPSPQVSSGRREHTTAAPVSSGRRTSGGGLAALADLPAGFAGGATARVPSGGLGGQFATAPAGFQVPSVRSGGASPLGSPRLGSPRGTAGGMASLLEQFQTPAATGRTSPTTPL